MIKIMKRSLFIIFLISSVIAVWLIGFIYFISIIPQENPSITPHAQAIIVLTGGSKRISEAVELLNRNQADLLFISGVGGGANVTSTLILSGTLPDNIYKFYDNIQLGYEAETTKENASEVANWIKRRHINSILLVTSNYHLPRSLLELKSKISDVSISSHCVFPYNVKIDSWWNHRGTLKLVFLEYNKYITAYLRILMEKYWL